MDQNISAQVIDIVLDILQQRGTVVGESVLELRLVQDGHIDSVDIVTLVARCEERFHICFEVIDFDENVFDSVSRLCDRVEKRLRDR
jgi:acyl carrier protein